MAFIQTPPALGNQYDGDRALRSLLERALPEDVLQAVRPALREMGDAAGGRLYAAQLAGRADVPVHVPWDAWGNRVDRIEVTPLWREAARLAAVSGLVATAHERAWGRHSRIVQFALVHLFAPSTDTYACPLAMSDGAAVVLAGARDFTEAPVLVGRLVSRDPAQAWTSGQWMTEATGGSDVGLAETEARRGEDGRWRLFGRKWFASAIDAPMALALARPQGNPPGGRGLALFCVRTRGPDGRPDGFRIDRLKDKLGTRAVPTAELTLDGIPADPVSGLDNGVRAIAPLLNVTRIWNAVCSVAAMRRGIALAADYASRRVAFGAMLTDKPLHADTLAGLAAEYRAGLHFAFHVADLMGRIECGEAGEQEAHLLRMLTPLLKLLTGRQAVAVTAEVAEAFGGAGYIEDTGVPALVRDAHVFPIWEGTTNVLALDALRALGGAGGLRVSRAAGKLLREVVDPSLLPVCAHVEAAFDRAGAWLDAGLASGEAAVEGGARRFALTLGRAFSAALLAAHGQWALGRGDGVPAAAARRFAASGIDVLFDAGASDSAALAAG